MSKKVDSVYLNKPLQDDNVYGDVQMFNTSDLLVMPMVNGERDLNVIETASKLSQIIISNGRAVATVSPSYGLLENHKFFGKMENELIDEGIGYKRRSFNKNDAQFCVDYILNDDSKVIVVNDQKMSGEDDTIVPMIRLTNSYDGSMKTAGYLGFFRKVCDNGLHMAQTQIEFQVKHTKGNMEVFIPKIDDLVARFLDNEMYSLKDKIDKMKVHMVDQNQIYKWIEQLANEEKILTFNKSKENLTPSSNAKIIHDIVLRDSVNTGVEPNAWLIYSAYNEFIHGKLNQNFVKQKDMDTRVFNNVARIVGA